MKLDQLSRIITALIILIIHENQTPVQLVPKETLEGTPVDTWNQNQLVLIIHYLTNLKLEDKFYPLYLGPFLEQKFITNKILFVI